jgi:hypothetical protein
MSDRITDTQEMQFGPSWTKWGDNELGETTGDTTWEYGLETYDVKSEERGLRKRPVSNQTLTVTVPILATSADRLANVLPWATKTTDSEGNVKLVVGNAIGIDLVEYAQELVLHPKTMTDSDKSKDVTIFKCYPVPGPITFTYNSQAVRVANIKFEAILNDNDQFFGMGDQSIEADTTPPTVSSTDPVDDATDIPVASGLNIDFVMSEDMDGDTIIKANTNLINLSTGAPVTDYTASYVSASKTIRLTTTAALAASTQYAAILGIGVKDVAGNALAAPNVVTFTTASE